MKKRKKKSYTVIFIPDDNGKTFYFKIHKFIIYSIIFFSTLLSIGVIFIIFQSGKIGTKLQLTQSLIKENERLKGENEKIKRIWNKIESINETSAYIKRLSSAVGETNLEIPIAKTSLSEKEKIFIEDSLDVFIGKIRKNEYVAYNNPKLSSVSQEDLAHSIPNISPVDGWITKKFLRDKHNPFINHFGVDFAAKSGSLIRATAPGIVVSVVNDKYYGLFVTIDHKYGFSTRYGHCMKILVSKGDNIERGQTIALLGNTGRSTAPHIHYEILKDNKNIDPLKYIFDRLD